VSLERVFAGIEGRRGAYVAELQRLMRQPSVTVDAADCAACADLVAAMMLTRGIEARVLPAKHNPMVVGQTPQRPDRPTLLVTGHYDVVEPGPRDAWVSDPFGAVLRDGDIVGRGAADPKGNLMAGIEAAAALREFAGDIPLNLKWLVDGDDEAHLGDLGGFADRHRDLLRSDGVLLIDAGFTRDNNSPVHLGMAGSLGVELRVRTGSNDPYFIWTQLIPDAAYRLTWALAGLKGPDERVLVDGFYDGVRPPTDAEALLMREYPWRDDGEIEFWGIDRFVGGVTGVDAVRRLLYEPTCSIHGFEPTWNRAGGSSLIPSDARARVNFHLVPDQSPDDILAKLRAHLDRAGFGDVEIEVFRSRPPIAGSADSPLGHALLRAARHANVSTYLLPHSFELGSKWCWLGQRLGVEGAMIGVGDPDRRAHFPNEHMTVRRYLDGIKWIAAAYWEYARTGSR
jgi:acetylornithine deacetylase/succinyl-diaminopimelate desuccinylase-like protein